MKRDSVIFLIAFLIVIPFLLRSVSAEYSTSLVAFDKEQDEESQAQSNDSRVYVNEWTVFYANYSSDDGYDLGQVLWRNPSDLGTGYAVVAIDADGDGNKSEFVYSESDNMIAYRGNGSQIYNIYNSSFDYAYGIVAGDFNNDSADEIAFISSGGRFFILNASNGVLLFSTQDFYSGYSLTNGDVDDDGRKDDFVIGVRDVLGGTGNNYGILVYIYNESSGNFEHIWNASDVTDRIIDIAISEISGGENLIAVAADDDGRATVYYGNGTLKFRYGSDRGTVYSVTFFDYDSDGKEDEVAYGESSELRVYDDNGTELYYKTEPSGAEYEIVAVDLEGDGIKDDILLGSYYDFYAFYSNGTIAWTFRPPHREFEESYYAHYYNVVRVGNVTSDSNEEIILGGYGNEYWILNLSGSILGKHYHRDEENLGDLDYIGLYYSKSIGVDILDDVNGDGISDIVSDRYSGYVYVGQQVMCKINVSGRERYMNYNYTSRLWEYNYFFGDSQFNKSSEEGVTFNWSISCEKSGYQSQTSTKNVTVYLKNSSLEAFDQEADDEDKAGWLSEDVVTVNETTYFFVNYTDLVDNKAVLDEIGIAVKWTADPGYGYGFYDGAIADFDGDGLKESFVFASNDRIDAYSVSGSLRWVTSAWYYDYLYNLRAGDFNNDSVEEVAGASSHGELFIFDANGSEIFRSDDFYTGYTLETGDVNGDGIEDLVMGVRDINAGTSNNYGIVVHAWNASTASFQKIWSASDGTNRPIDIAISEISGGENLVGYTDYAGERRAYVYYGNGTYAWESTNYGSYAYDIEFFDYDSDGREDELIVGEYSETYIHDSSGLLATHTAPTQYVYDIASLDLDGDGKEDDYVFVERYGAMILDQAGSAVWNYDSGFLNSLYTVLETIDLNGDGKKEILIGTYDGVLYIYNMSGSLIHKYSFVLPGSMDSDERARFGITTYGSGLGMEVSDEIDGKTYFSFALENAYVGVAEIWPRCVIYFSDSLTARMAYNSSSGLYYYNRTFPLKGPYTWNVSCESYNHVTRRATRTLNVNTPPSFFSISHSPSSLDGLDPNVTITVRANISDINNNLDSAILQYKNSTQDWNNVTMVNQTAKGIYTLMSASFIPPYSREDNYTYRIWVNDSEGESNRSSNTTLSVYWDCNWNVSSDLGVKAGWDENKEVGNMTINNTGDVQYADSNCSLSFHLTHSLGAGRIYFNNWAQNQWVNYYDTSTLSAKSSLNIVINVSFGSSAKEETFTITNSEVGGIAKTASRNTTGTIITTTGGPYLYQKLESYPSSLYLTFQNFSLLAYLSNVMGDGTLNNTAFNVSFNWSLFSDFLVKDGNSSLFYDNLSTSSPNYNNLNITFNSTNLPDMSPGTGKIYLYALGYNSSGDLIKHAGNVTLLSQQVNVSLLCYNTSDGVCVSDCGYLLDFDCSEPSEEAGSGGGGGGGGSAGTQLETTYEESEAYFELLIGEEQDFMLEIENSLADVKANISINVSGINTKYIEIIPNRIERLEPYGSQNVTVRITAPAYFTRGKYILTFLIDGDIISDKTRTLFSEKKIVTLYTIEVSRQEADSLLNLSGEMLEKMNSSGMAIEDVLVLVKEARDHYNEVNFLGVRESYEKIREIHDAAFEALAIIDELKEKIKEAEDRGIKIIDTKKILYLGEAAFSRGDYQLALEKLKEVKLAYALEVKGEFNIIYTIKNHPLEILLGLVGVGIFSFGSSLIVKFGLYKKKLKYLQEEEKLLLELMKAVQRECFEKNKMSMNEYEEAMSQYETKLSKTIEEKVRLETKIANILKIKGKKKALDEEKKRLVRLIKDIQDRYLRKGELEIRIYENMLKSYSTRLSEVEEQITFLNAQEALRGGRLPNKILKKLKLR